MTNPLERQINGVHYSMQAIQPVEYATANGLGYCESLVLRYITRHKQKGGAEDLHKAIHCLQMLIELEYTDKPEPFAKHEPTQLENVETCPQPPANSNGRPFIHVLRECCNTHELDSERNTVGDLLHALHKDEHHGTARTVHGMISTNNLTNSVKLGPFFRLITEGQIECKSCS